MGEILPNHSYVDLSLVGNADDGSDSVQCHTDLDTCCSRDQGIHRADWYPPGSDTRLPFYGRSSDIYEQRAAQRVDLRRRNNADMPSGIYRCDIPTNAVQGDSDTRVRETLYVGLYASGGEKWNMLYNMYMYLLFLHVGDIEIQDIALQLGSDLNGANPQFTLTCISTGGPATTVTWTRDSIIVMGVEMSALDNTTTAQYTHILTVTGRMGGFYQCSVANAKPSSNSASLIVLGIYTWIIMCTYMYISLCDLMISI